MRQFWGEIGPILPNTTITTQYIQLLYLAQKQADSVQGPWPDWCGRHFWFPLRFLRLRMLCLCSWRVPGDDWGSEERSIFLGIQHTCILHARWGPLPPGPPVASFLIWFKPGTRISADWNCWLKLLAWQRPLLFQFTSARPYFKTATPYIVVHSKTAVTTVTPI